jgi:hypothetical protein
MAFAPIEGSETSERTRDSWHVDAKLEQVSDEGLPRDRVGRKELTRRRSVARSQVMTAKGDLRNVRHRETDPVDEVACGGVAPGLPASIERNPQMSLGVDGGTVRMALLGIDPDERTRI